MVESKAYDSLTLNLKTGSAEMVIGDSFTSYDSPESFNIKYRYSFDQCLRGIMWWAVDLIQEPIELYEAHPSVSPSISVVPTTETKTPTQHPTSYPTSSPTEVPPCGMTCPDGANGLLPQLDCVGYYRCRSGVRSEVTKCLSGTIFDEDLQTCNWPWATTCKCTKDMIELGSSPSETPRPSPVPKKTCSAGEQNTVNFGYYQSWAAGRGAGCNPVQPGSIEVDYFGYTHLAFSFAGISLFGELEPYGGDASFFSKFKSFNGLKKKYPDLKTLIAVGGWTFPQKRFVSVSSTEEKRTKFALSVAKFLQMHEFDGIDLDWE